MKLRAALSILVILFFIPACTPAATPAPTPTASPFVFADDFEGDTTAWQPGLAPEYADSSASAVALSPENAAQGKQSLQLTFGLDSRPKAIFFLATPLDLGQARTLHFDLYNPGTVGGVGFAVTTGEEEVWYESNTINAVKGPNSFDFDLTASDYKAASTNWEFRTPIEGLDQVHRLAIVLYPAAAGSAFLDNITIRKTTVP